MTATAIHVASLEVQLAHAKETIDLLLFLAEEGVELADHVRETRFGEESLTKLRNQFLDMQRLVAERS